ncbi:nuclear transport factor 2 family protein [Nakamurella sp. GG22]
MPWFPEFYSAVELARRQTHAAGQADPVGQYFSAVTRGDTQLLERAWPGEVVVFDPRAGKVRGHRQLRRFIHRNQLWLSERNARTETIASTRFGNRAVVELLVHIDGDSGRSEWPVAVVAESPDTLSVVFRTYCSQWPVDGRRHVRAPILTSGPTRAGDVVGRFRAALDAGDVDAAVNCFTPDGYVRESTGPHPIHRGSTALRSYFAAAFSAGGGIGMQDMAVTDDGTRSAVEYNCVRWGSEPLPPQAGLAVHQRGPGDLLTAVRIYDDVQPPSALR